MGGLLALIGLGVILWWISKGLKKLGEGLKSMSVTAADLISIHNKKPLDNNNIIRQNQQAEENLQTIIGEASHVAYTHTVKDEIERLTQEISAGSSSKWGD